MSEPHLDLSGSQLLLVDDVQFQLAVLRNALEHAGYAITTATSGQEALDTAVAINPDLILLDVVMPDMDGYETCRQLKRNPATSDIPVIFLTSRDETESILKGFHAGGVDYLPKSFQQEELLIRIQTQLKCARLTQEVIDKNQQLAEMNTHLEELVDERTQELQLRLKELEGKDRIAQHLLTVHTLEDTLAVVLDVVADVLGLDRATLYLNSEDGLTPAAASGLAATQLDALSPTPLHQQTFAEVQQTRTPTFIGQPATHGVSPFAVVPILRGSDVLGLLQVDLHTQRPPMDETELQTLASFALQAAVAIGDAQIMQNAQQWEEQLDVVDGVEELDEFDDMIEGVEELDEPDRGHQA